MKLLLLIFFPFLAGDQTVEEICEHHCVAVDDCRQSYVDYEYTTYVDECMIVCRYNRSQEDPEDYIRVWDRCKNEVSCNWILCVEADEP